MDRTPVALRTRMGRRQAFADIHEGVGLSQQDIEHLRQVYISACFSGIHRRPSHIIPQSQSYDMDCEDGSCQLNPTSRQRSVPAVLNELSMDSRLIKFLETQGYKGNGPMIVKIPADGALGDQSDHIRDASNEANFIDMLTQKLAAQATLGSKSTEFLDSSKDFTGNDLAAGKIQRRLDRSDIVSSPRFRQRRDALGNILDNIDVRQLRKQLSVPADLGSVLQFAMPEVTSQKITQIDAPLAF